MATPRKPARKKTGRPSKYKKDYSFAAHRLCRAGATVSEVATQYRDKPSGDGRKSMKSFVTPWVGPRPLAE